MVILVSFIIYNRDKIINHLFLRSIDMSKARRLGDELAILGQEDLSDKLENIVNSQNEDENWPFPAEDLEPRRKQLKKDQENMILNWKSHIKSFEADLNKIDTASPEEIYNLEGRLQYYKKLGLV